MLILLYKEKIKYWVFENMYRFPFFEHIKTSKPIRRQKL